MRRALDAVTVSSILFLVLFLLLLPAAVKNLSSFPQQSIQIRADIYMDNYILERGYSLLTVILIGLIVAYRFLQKRSRSDWWILFVIVWVYIFPTYALQLLLGISDWPGVDWPGWFKSVVTEPGLARSTAASLLLFVLMVFALFLPIRAVFFRGAPPFEV